MLRYGARSHDTELRRLFAILSKHRNGLREYDLVRALRGQNPLRGLDELGLFRVHFLLFHHLHRLKRALEERRGGGLEIHCLCIRLLPLQGAPPNSERLPRAADPLAAYYLDLTNLRRIGREEVQGLLRWFWRRYRVHERREEALAILDLGPKATPAEVRRRYRELARLHHPDGGGDAGAFCRLSEAMAFCVCTGWGEVCAAPAS